MKNDEFEQLLTAGKAQAQRFFSRPCVASPPRRRPPRFKLVCAALLTLIAAAVLLAVFGLIPATPSAEHQTVLLDDSNREYEVRFVPVQMPRNDASGYMVMLWEIETNGRSQMVYSDLLSMCDKLYPVYTVALPGSDRSLLLLVSGDSRSSYLHYRLLSYSQGFAHVWRAQDFVPNGHLEVRDGLVVEERSTVEAADGMPQLRTTVTYIIPYGFSDTDGIVLPVSSLRLHIGEQLLLTGETDGEAVTLSGSGPVTTLPSDGDALLLEASGEGSGTLTLTAADGSSASLAVTVIE